MVTRTRLWIVAFAFCGVWPAAAGWAATRHVPEQYSTIGAAIAAAHNGDRILVADGIYAGPGNRNLDYQGKHIRIVSVNGPENCIIDCEGQGRAFWFHNGETPAAKLEGFTIQNGLIVGGLGGAVLCDSASPTIRDCIFRWNTVAAVSLNGGGALALVNQCHSIVSECVFEENAQTGGGDNGGGAVLAAFGTRPSIVACTFAGNYASLGGAVAAPEGCRIRMRDCVFYDNVAEDNAGALLCSLGGDVTLERCEFSGNSAGTTGGGVVIVWESSARVRQCTFQGNTTLGTYGGGGGGLAVGERSSAVVDDTIFSGNSGTGDGGAVVLWDDSDLTLVGSTVAGNDAPLLNGHEFGGGVCAWGSRLTVLNTVFHGNVAGEGPAMALVLPAVPDQPMIVTVAGSLMQEGQGGVFVEDPNDPNFVVTWSEGNFDGDPMFKDPLGLDGMPWTGDEDLHLLPGSPCIDAGDPAYAPQPDEVDIDGDPRVLDGDGDGVAVIDIGADEFAPTP